MRCCAAKNCENFSFSVSLIIHACVSLCLLPTCQAHCDWCEDSRFLSSSHPSLCHPVPPFAEFHPTHPFLPLPLPIAAYLVSCKAVCVCVWGGGGGGGGQGGSALIIGASHAERPGSHTSSWVIIMPRVATLSNSALALLPALYSPHHRGSKSTLDGDIFLCVNCSLHLLWFTMPVAISCISPSTALLTRMFLMINLENVWSVHFCRTLLITIMYYLLNKCEWFLVKNLTSYVFCSV